MSYSIRLQIEAIVDAQTAFEWYEQQQAGLGNEFIIEAEICYVKLCEHP